MRPRFILAPAVAVLSALLLANTCGPTSTASVSDVRFVLSTRADVQQPVYAQVTAEDNQPGWVRVSRLGERIFLRERCEVPDCGQPPAVCGAAIPLVRNIAVDTRSIELSWDRTMSLVDPSKACETRNVAPAGDYVAQFCFSRRAELTGGELGRDTQGTVLQPTCKDVRFSLPGASEVVLEITNASF